MFPFFQIISPYGQTINIITIRDFQTPIRPSPYFTSHYGISIDCINQFYRWSYRTTEHVSPPPPKNQYNNTLSVLKTVYRYFFFLPNPLCQRLVFTLFSLKYAYLKRPVSSSENGGGGGGLIYFRSGSGDRLRALDESFDLFGGSLENITFPIIVLYTYVLFSKYKISNRAPIYNNTSAH